MLDHLPRTLPEHHRRFLTNAVSVLAGDPGIVGLAAGGSFITDTMDEYSDLDLIVVAESSAYERVLAERQALARSLGSLLSAFTGEHVSEPRLLVCLYGGEHPLHVDLKFVSILHVATRVEDPVVLWERDAALTRALADGVAIYPGPRSQWIEDRFWVWVHYVATKIGRGELFEVQASLAHLRGMVLGPLALARAGARPSGVRRLEGLSEADLELLRPTVAGLSRSDSVRALRASIAAYRELRARDDSLVLRDAAERAAIEYLDRVEASAR